LSSKDRRRNAIADVEQGADGRITDGRGEYAGREEGDKEERRDNNRRKG